MNHLLKLKRFSEIICLSITKARELKVRHIWGDSLPCHINQSSETLSNVVKGLSLWGGVNDLQNIFLLRIKEAVKVMVRWWGSKKLHGCSQLLLDQLSFSWHTPGQRPNQPWHRLINLDWCLWLCVVLPVIETVSLLGNFTPFCEGEGCNS